MTVRSERRAADCVVVIDGDVAAPATLVQLRAALSALVFTECVPVVVDLTATSGTSSSVQRLLDRTAKVMRHRGIPFDVVHHGLVST